MFIFFRNWIMLLFVLYRLLIIIFWENKDVPQTINKTIIRKSKLFFFLHIFHHFYYIFFIDISVLQYLQNFTLICFLWFIHLKFQRFIIFISRISNILEERVCCKKLCLFLNLKNQNLRIFIFFILHFLFLRNICTRVRPNYIRSLELIPLFEILRFT